MYVEMFMLFCKRGAMKVLCLFGGSLLISVGIIKFTIIALVFFVSLPAMSAVIAEGGRTTPAKITSVQIIQNNFFRIETETDDVTSAVCASYNGIYWWPATDALSKEIYSAALAAYAGGKKISVVYADECNIYSKRLKDIFVVD